MFPCRPCTAAVLKELIEESIGRQTKCGAEHTFTDEIQEEALYCRTRASLECQGSPVPLKTGGDVTRLCARVQHALSMRQDGTKGYINTSQRGFRTGAGHLHQHLASMA